MKLSTLRKIGLLTLVIISLFIGFMMNKERMIVAYLKMKFAPLHPYENYEMPERPDYSQPKFWAALPEIEDPADNAPEITGLTNKQASAEVDVFYVHPTTFYEKDSGWTADAAGKISFGAFDPLHYQASVFNGSARIYAPHYRQATVFSFFDDSGQGKKALHIARKDIINAFIYYLAHYNKGRPFMLAGHSQGSLMLIPILKYLDRYPNDKFITAYVPGWGISSESFERLKPCGSPTELDCFNVWNAKAWGSQLEEFVTPSRYLGADCVNPMSWKNNEETVSKSEHLGSIDLLGTKLDKNYVTAACRGEMLWVKLPDDPLYQSKLNKNNYHVVDFALFYFNIRKNIEERITAFKALK